MTKASLGTSPISSIPYVLSLNFPFTLGNFTIIFSLLLIALQILILRKNFKIENILQIPFAQMFIHPFFRFPCLRPAFFCIMHIRAKEVDLFFLQHGSAPSGGFVVPFPPDFMVIHL